MTAIIYNPTLTLNLGFTTIYTWGLFVSIGIIFALILAKFLSRKNGLNFDHFLNITLISIIFGFIGARLFYVFLEPDNFEHPAEILQIWDGGLALYGGLALAVFGSVIYAKKNKLNILHSADLIIPSIIIALAIARIGCLLVNDHLGKLTNLPWGIEVGGISRHPVSAYYSLSLFLLLIIIFVFRQKMLKKKGVITFFALTWYSLFRFIIDNFKDFEGKTADFYANQIFLLLVFAVSSYFLIVRLWQIKVSRDRTGMVRASKASERVRLSVK